MLKELSAVFLVNPAESLKIILKTGGNSQIYCVSSRLLLGPSSKQGCKKGFGSWDLALF
jgi:hypothetical protein